MKIETKIELKDYIKLMFILTYRKGSIIFSSIMGVFLAVITVATLTGDMVGSDGFPVMPLVLSMVILIVIPASVYYSATKNYNTHSRLQETITYEIDHQLIRSIGESFNSEMDWSKMHKVLELNSWFLLYQNKMVANLIPKQAMGEQRHELREIIKKQNIKYKLKKD
ncbi:YcxB family protein [Carboxylicivirga mesophila]|uniref:YcxB family protein n=1 Tax=Carboxylicivirga mesophila TaxID=1166478 RepID=A0ABS5KFC2_9BACT|nr:YcxB family protein [Carboxylicivirga mesophila]MBS2213597.1 YcxB family protein [Carboxylicivirga mesophila]